MDWVGQKPSDAFNGSPAQQLLQVKGNLNTAKADGLESQGIEGRDSVWWLDSWQHWHQDGDGRLSGCTDFDAMHFVETRRIRLGGAWGCVLAWMRGTQTTPHDAQLLNMVQATFRLAGTVCGRRTPGIMSSGRDAQQMSNSSSGNGTGTGSDMRAELASGDQTTSEDQLTDGQPGNNASSEDNTNVVTRAMNEVELLFARSQATVIMHNLMQELTIFVTSSLSGGAGEENATMAAAPEEHRSMLMAVRTQAEDYAKAQYKEMQANGLTAAQPEGELRGKPASLVSMGIGLQPGQESECGTASSAAEAAAATLEAMVTAAPGREAMPPEKAMLPDEAEDGASAEMTAVHTSRHEDDVTYVTTHTEEIMKLRSIAKWERVLRGAINADAAEQVGAADELLQLGIPAAHWRELEVHAKLERGEWVIFNANVLGTYQHFVLLKPKLK